MSDGNLALAIAGLDAAIASLMVQREALRRVQAGQAPVLTEKADPGICAHPQGSRHTVATMGGGVPIIFCNACGEDITGAVDD